MALSNKIVRLGNEIGEEVWGYKRGSELLEKFAKSIELSQNVKFIAQTNIGTSLAVCPELLRRIVVTGIPWYNPRKGRIDIKNAVISLLNWFIEKSNS